MIILRMRRSRATVAVYCLSRRLCINKKERDSEKKNSIEMLQREQLVRGKEHYHIYSNKRRGAHVIFPATNVALSRGRRLFKHCTRKIYFFCIFIQQYTFYLLIFSWTDTKLIKNLQLREKFTR